jgi:hypothetical protein
MRLGTLPDKKQTQNKPNSKPILKIRIFTIYVRLIRCSFPCISPNSKIRFKLDENYLIINRYSLWVKDQNNELLNYICVN